MSTFEARDAATAGEAGTDVDASARAALDASVRAPSADRPDPEPKDLALGEASAVVDHQLLHVLRRIKPENARRHLRRVASRFGGLVLADLGTFGLLRELYRFLGERAGVGEAIARPVLNVMPSDYLNGWQFALALFLGLFITGNYGPGDRRRDPARLLSACALASALVLWSALWTRGPELVLLQYTLTTAAVWGGLVAARFAVDSAVARWLAGQPHVPRALVIGAESDFEWLSQHTAGGFDAGLQLVGHLAPPRRGSGGAAARSLEATIRQRRVEALLVAEEVPGQEFRRLADTALATGCQLLVCSRRLMQTGFPPAVVWRGGLPFVEFAVPTLLFEQLVAKRLLDLVIASAATLVVLPVSLVIALLIRLDGKGPVLFLQRRVGRYGVPFRCLKFRTMAPDADARLRQDPELYREYLMNDFKLPADRDPRLTRVGRLLRRWSLDELPQLWNVLRGDMSLVGPRPIVPEELEHYGGDAALFLSLKPGVTGAWAVNGRSKVGYPDRVDVELAYVRNWTLLRDLAILVRTAPAVLGGRGAW